MCVCGDVYKKRNLPLHVCLRILSCMFLHVTEQKSGYRTEIIIVMHLCDRNSSLLWMHARFHNTFYKFLQEVIEHEVSCL